MGEGLVGRDRDVGGDAGALPVGAGGGADRAGDGDGQLQVRVQPVALARVGAAAGPLADDGAAGPQLLQVVGELLGAGERGRPDQHVQRLGGAEPRTRHVRRRPGLHGLAGVPLVHGHQVRLLVQQVAADQRDRARVATAVLPQVEQQRVGVGHQLQRQAERRAGELHREQLRRQREVHDVAVQPVDPGDPVRATGPRPGPAPPGRPPRPTAPAAARGGAAAAGAGRR